MDGRGGCCIASYGANGVYDMSKMDMIMLRFRPIAPKPAAGAGSSGASSPEKADAYVKSGGRGKRKYVKSNNSNSSNSSGSSSSGNTNSSSNKRCNSKKRKASPEVVTLPLLPETPDRKDSPARLSPPAEKKEAAARADLPVLLSFDGKNNNSNNQVGFWSSDRTVVMGVGSCVIVECVNDTWTVDGQLGSTDEERRMSLERDTCPGFVSDGLGRVTWTNGAYRKMMMMMGHDDHDDHDHDNHQHHEVAVWLVIKEESLREIMARTLSYTSFTCRVRLVQYDTCGKERSSITLPCDVWRMDGGGFAWRLDVKAALSLGR
nr:uncharacterized protein LOC112021193 [Quercus suber]